MAKRVRNGCWYGKLQALLQAAMVLSSSPRKQSLRFGSRAHITSCWLTLVTLVTCASMLRFSWSSSSGDVVVVGCGSGQEVQPLLPLHRFEPSANLSALEAAFWKQPDGGGFVPCIEPSEEYKRESVSLIAQRDKYLMVVVSGGVNQQRNQIVDSVVMARILDAALVVPIMQVNPIWEDERYHHLYSIPLPTIH